jgi:hypothetical protein
VPHALQLLLSDNENPLRVGRFHRLAARSSPRIAGELGSPGDGHETRDVTASGRRVLLFHERGCRQGEGRQTVCVPNPSTKIPAAHRHRLAAGQDHGGDGGRHAGEGPGPTRRHRAALAERASLTRPGERMASGGDSQSDMQIRLLRNTCSASEEASSYWSAMKLVSDEPSRARHPLRLTFQSAQVGLTQLHFGIDIR